LLTVAQVARTLRLSKASVYKLVAERKLPHVRIGNAIRFLPNPADYLTWKK
jgi:excisionase family DNA binding protein